jgi:hypothetical protein
MVSRILQLFTSITAKTNMSRLLNEIEHQKQLYCTPPHITKALLKRELFHGSIWEPAAGRGDIVKVLRACNYLNIHASDIEDWGFQPCQIENSLETTREYDCLITNPPFDVKFKFLEHAKQFVRHKFALLLPLQFENTVTFIEHHQSDPEFPWVALYAFPQSIRWLNAHKTWGKIQFGWFVFERKYFGEVRREKILFRRNKTPR